MARLADNVIYLSVGGTQVQTYWRECEIERSNSAVETTSGSGVDHVMRAPGLDDTKVSGSIAYDADNVATYIQKLRAGQTVEIEFGTEGNVSGKPRHVQEFVITSGKVGRNVDKSMPTWDFEGEGAAAATVDMFTGAVYS